MNLDLIDSKVIVLAAVLIPIAAVLVWLFVRNRRRTSAGLRKKFGPEYDWAVLAHGSEKKAESQLADRQNANDIRSSGRQYSLALSILQRGQSQKLTTWCPPS
jgi:hypothetical protein